MILRAIEDKRFSPVGADREVASDFQLIAGTNRDLARGRGGRPGSARIWWARLNLWTFDLPGLKERREDIEPQHRVRAGATCGRGRGGDASTREARAALPRLRHVAGSGNGAPISATSRASITRLATLAPSGADHPVRVVEEEIERLRRLWARPGHGRRRRWFRRAARPAGRPSSTCSIASSLP